MDTALHPDESVIRTMECDAEANLVPVKTEDVNSLTNEDDDVGSTINEDEDVYSRSTRDYHICAVRETDSMFRKLRTMKRLGYQTGARNFRMVAYKAVAGMLSDQFKDKFTPESVKNHWRLFRSHWNRAKVEAETPLDTPAMPRARPRRPNAATFMLRNSFHHLERLLDEPYTRRGGWTRDKGWTGQWRLEPPVSASSNRQTTSRHRQHRRHHNANTDLSGRARESSDMMAATLSHVQARRKVLILAACAVAYAAIAEAESDDEYEDDDE